MMASANDAESLLATQLLASGMSFALETGKGSLFPVGYNGNTTSAGDSTTLNATGVGASGISTGDYIKNITTGYTAVVLAVNTNSIKTSELESGTWGDGDEYAVGGFMLKLHS